MKQTVSKRSPKGFFALTTRMMLTPWSHCAPTAHWGDTFPSVATALFRVEVVEMILAEGSTVIVQAIMSGPIPADPLGIAKDGEDVHIGHCYILRYDPKGKIARLDCYWDNAVLNGIVKSKL